MVSLGLAYRFVFIVIKRFVGEFYTGYSQSAGICGVEISSAAVFS